MLHERRTQPRWYVWASGRIVRLPRCLYLAITQDSRLVKVGLSCWPNERVEVLKRMSYITGQQADFRVVGCAVGTSRDESAIHAAVRDTFGSEQIAYYPEFFHWTPALDGFLRHLFPMTVEDAMARMTEMRSAILEARDAA